MDILQPHMHALLSEYILFVYQYLKKNQGLEHRRGKGYKMLPIPGITFDSCFFIFGGLGGAALKKIIAQYLPPPADLA